MPTYIPGENVPCRVCGAGLLAAPPLFGTREQAKAWGQREFQRLAPQRQLAFKARTCSVQCYAALPPWRRLLLKSFWCLGARLGI